MSATTLESLQPVAFVNKRQISQKDIEIVTQITFTAVIGRSAVDSDFLDKLKSDPEAVFSEYPDLNDDEKEALKSLDPNELDSLNAATTNTDLEAIVNKKDG